MELVDEARSGASGSGKGWSQWVRQGVELVDEARGGAVRSKRGWSRWE